jgi:hypothetical protein
MEQAEAVNGLNPERKPIMSMQDWLELDLESSETEAVIGTPQHPIVRPKTKNLVVAPEKSFKTTFLLRLMAGLSTGETVFPMLPIQKEHLVLYLHGELSDPEIKERGASATVDLPGPWTGFFQGRLLEGHLIESSGQKEIRKYVEDIKPDQVVLDPWQSFISGYDENCFKEISVAQKFCSDLIYDFGVTLWIPIHVGKDRKKGPRGHSSMPGWRDTEFSLYRSGSALTVKVDPRWGGSPLQFPLKFRDQTLWFADLFEGTGQACDIVAFVKAHGGAVTKEQIQNFLGKKEDTVRKAIDRAVQGGLLLKVGDQVTLPLDSRQDIEANIM